MSQRLELEKQTQIEPARREEIYRVYDKSRSPISLIDFPI